MPDPTPTVTFTFEVNGQNMFEYRTDRPIPSAGDWDYNHADIIRFQTHTGTFRIEFNSVPPGGNVLGGPLAGTQAGGQGPWFVDTHVMDNLTPEQREEIRRSHISANDPDGFVGKYKYIIDVIRHTDGRTFHDDQKDGEYSC
ncbi:MAG: hypothetical protein IT165_38015 [Bryobacterales bacterium]|nr:hypothetical protein [Bryobacterales bacterium]